MDEIIVFPWNTNFETGIEEIDDQHKTLVALLNKLANTLVHDDPVEVNQVFKELADYASYHFDAEEKIWDEYFNFEDTWFVTHTLSHASFLPNVLEMKEMSSGKAWQESTEGILRFLIRWLAFHILDEDKKMSFVIHGIKDGLSPDEARVKADRQMSGSVRVLIDTVLKMYENLSSHALELIRERHRRVKVEKELREANAKLEKLSITDDLTGLFNRRYFHELAPIEFRRAVREKLKISFISLDLDYFKKLNDQLGHLKGDEALVMVGNAVAEQCKRSGDFAFRMGGEELLIMISGSSSDAEIESFAEAIREKVSKIVVKNEDNGISCELSASIGLFSKVPDSEDDYIQWLEHADRALYQAKQKGRNRVVVYQ
ncbi:GGDEF domain-containing protein [Vibrio sp. HN007]|uniref:GGDEF domain-containing protein n=1 Tax=Vibrio iocasae TaxID=3098914 RepID=UPI0035D4BD5D